MSTATTETPAVVAPTPSSASPDDFYKAPAAAPAAAPQADPNAKPTATPADATAPKATIADGAAPAVEAKPADKPAAAADDIVLTAPDGYLLDKSRVADVVAFAKEHKLPQEVASKILNRENEVVAGIMQAQADAFEKEARIKWVETVKADPEMGGDNFKQTAAFAHRALKQFGSPALVKELNESGYGNHPELVRLLAKVGRIGADDKLIPGNGNPPAAPKNTEDIFYGSKKE